MQAEVKNGNLIVTIPIFKNPVASSSGKTVIVASSHGFAPTTAEHNGKPISISLNATVKP